MTDNQQALDRAILGLRNWVLRNGHGGIIPPYMLAPVARYLLLGQRPECGDFLEAVILDLPFSQVVPLADDDNCKALMTWHRLLHNIFPAQAWKSPGAVLAWCKQGGTSGQLPIYLDTYAEIDQ